MASKKSIYFVTLVHQLWWDSKPVHQEASRSNPFSFFVCGSHCLFKCLLLQEYARTSIRFSFSFWYVSPIWSSFPWQMLSLSIEQKLSAHIPCRNVCVGLSLNVNRPSVIIRGLGRRWTWPVSRRRLFIEKKRDAHFWTSCFLLLLLGVPRLGGDGPMRKPGRHPIDNLTWTCLIRNRKKKARGVPAIRGGGGGCGQHELKGSSSSDASTSDGHYHGNNTTVWRRRRRRFSIWYSSSFGPSGDLSLPARILTWLPISCQMLMYNFYRYLFIPGCPAVAPSCLLLRNTPSTYNKTQKNGMKEKEKKSLLLNLEVDA